MHRTASSTPPSRLRPIALATSMAGSLLLSAGVLAASETTLPVVSVTATTGNVLPAAALQAKPAAVGKSAVAIQDTPFAISVVDVAAIRETGAKSVQDALLYSAGVYSGRYGFDTRIDSAAVRGMSPSSYLDGLRGLYGFYNNVRPDIYALERVEVLKGPSSALYGQGDLGGIVNVVSKRPKEDAAREIEVQLGSYDRKQLAMDLTGPLNEEGSLLYRLVALQRDSGTQVDHVNDDAKLLMPSVTWRPSADTSLTLLYVHQQNDSKVSAQFLPSKGTISPAPLGQLSSSLFVGEPGWDRYDTKKDEVSVLWDQRLSQQWKLATVLRHTKSSSVTREHWTTVGAVPTDAGNMTRTIHTADRDTRVLSGDSRLEGDFTLGSTRHRVVVGVDYQQAKWNEYNYSYGATSGGTINLYAPVYGYVNTAALSFADRPDNKLTQTGIYLMDHVDWGRWSVSAALRRDRAHSELLNNGTPNVVVKNAATTGRLGLMYRFDNGVHPYLSYSKAFVPNLGTDGTASASYLKPTTGEQREAGVKYLAADGRTTATVAWFDIDQKNRVVDGKTPGGVEQVAASTKGWEAEIKHRIGALELQVGLSDLEAVNPQTGKRLSAIAERTASAWGQYKLQNGLRLGMGARYIGDNAGSGGNPLLPSVTLYDFMVGYNTGAWDYRLDIKNAADKQFLSWCRAQNQDCGFGERRNVNLTARYRF